MILSNRIDLQNRGDRKEWNRRGQFILTIYILEYNALLKTRRDVGEWR